MPRTREHATNAERQRAHRQRRADREAAVQRVLSAAYEARVDAASPLRAIQGQPSPSETEILTALAEHLERRDL